MNAPEKFGPDSGADINRSKGISIGESPKAIRSHEEAKKAAATERPEKRQSAASSKSSDVTSEKPAPFPWWLIASSIAIFVLALAGWLKARKPKSTP